MIKSLAIVVVLAVAGFAIGRLRAPSVTPSLADGLTLAVACRDGSAPACDQAQPFAARYGDYELFELDAACMVEDHAFACEELANDLHADDDANPEMRPLAGSRMARALSLFVAGCAAGRGESCAGASRVYGAGFGVPWNELASRTYGVAACELGVAAACKREGDRSTGDDAIRMYRKACPRSPHACAKVDEAVQR